MEKVVCAAWTILSFASSVLAGPHPNVLLVMVDDLRPALGCYGDMTAITPSIDALAMVGVTFSRAYAQQSLCGPSRTSLLTSRRPSSTTVVDVHRYWRSHGNYTTLPQHFRQHGYYTASAGKIFHPGLCSNFTDDAPYSWSGTPFHPSTQEYKNAPACGWHRNSSDIVCPVTVEEQPEQTLPDMQTAHYAISFLHVWKQLQQNGTVSDGSGRRAAAGPCTGRGCQQPFFLAVGFHKPHIPLKYPKEFLDLYPLSIVPLPPNRRLPPRLPPVAFNPWNDLRWRDDIARLNLTFPYQPVPDDYARLIIQSYYAATSYTDLLIGDLLTATEQLFPDTVVALLGDHGWSLGEHQEWSKFSNFEVATRVPFIVAGIRGYEKARRKLLISGETRKGIRDSGNSDGQTLTSSSNKLSHNKSTWKPRGGPRNDGSSKEKNSIGGTGDSSSNNNSRNDPPLCTGTRCSDEKYVELRKRKQMKLYLKIRRKLGRYFPKWRGHANRDDLGYEKYWRFSEFRTKFSMPKTSSLEKNRSQRRSGDYLPMRRNVTYDGIVELVDLFPTLVDLAGIQRVPVCQSISFSRKLDDEKQTKPLLVKDKAEDNLCTEGHSLSSIIIDNSIRKKVQKITVKPKHRFHSHQKDYIQYATQSSDDRKISRKTSSSVNEDTLLAPLECSTSLSSEPSILFDSHFNSSLPHLLNQRPRHTFTEERSTSDSNITLKPFEPLRLASKGEPTPHHHLLLPSASPLSKLSYSRCSATLSRGRVGLSQYPRPSLTPSQHPDSDQPRLTETIVMGYSMRSLCYRYTLWLAFNSTAFLPDFDIVYGEELYDHRIDPGENKNLVWSRQKVALIAEKRLRTELQRTLY